MTSFEKGIWGSPITARWLWFSSLPAPLPGRRRASPPACRDMSPRNRPSRSTSSSAGPRMRVRSIAARQGLQITKMLSDSAVFRASAAEIEALAAEVDHISRDVEVKSFMSVTNAAIGADQVQAGLAGLSPFTGAGVGIALIDSGVWTGHRALAGRVVFAKDFVGDGLAGRPLRPRHAHRRDDRGQLSPPAGPDVADAVPRRRAGRSSDQPARYRRRRHGQGELCDGRHRLGHPQPQALQHPRDQPVARRSRGAVVS